MKKIVEAAAMNLVVVVQKVVAEDWEMALTLEWNIAVGS